MAQNTAIATEGGLTIKFSPQFPIGATERTKLRNSLDLAKRALEKAYSLLSSIADAQTESNARVPEVPYLTLRYHFKLALTQLERSPRLEKLHWATNVYRIANILRQVHLGLMKPITIADAFATTVGQQVDKVVLRFQIANPTTCSEESKMQLLDDMAEAYDQGRAKAKPLQGVVHVKPAFVKSLSKEQKEAFENDKMTWQPERRQFVPAVQVPADKWGSIHVNFQELLKPEKAVSNLRVARTIIHEASHKFCSTQDHAYADRPIYTSMSKDEVMWNADSYAYVAVSLYKNFCFVTDAHMARMGGGKEDTGIDMNS